MRCRPAVDRPAAVPSTAGSCFTALPTSPAVDRPATAPLIAGPCVTALPTSCAAAPRSTAQPLCRRRRVLLYGPAHLMHWRPAVDRSAAVPSTAGPCSTTLPASCTGAPRSTAQLLCRRRRGPALRPCPPHALAPRGRPLSCCAVDGGALLYDPARLMHWRPAVDRSAAVPSTAGPCFTTLPASCTGAPRSTAQPLCRRRRGPALRPCPPQALTLRGRLPSRWTVDGGLLLYCRRHHALPPRGRRLSRRRSPALWRWPHSALLPRRRPLSHCASLYGPAPHHALRPRGRPLSHCAVDRGVLLYGPAPHHALRPRGRPLSHCAVDRGVLLYGPAPHHALRPRGRPLSHYAVDGGILLYGAAPTSMCWRHAVDAHALRASSPHLSKRFCTRSDISFRDGDARCRGV